jgi:hypothetical protein
VIAGILAAVPFIYAQFCFDAARREGRLQLLLALPITPQELVLAKFASLFSMTLFTINVAVVLLHDLRALAYSNVTGLFMASIFMSAAVVSEKPWAYRCFNRAASDSRHHFHLLPIVSRKVVRNRELESADDANFATFPNANHSFADGASRASESARCGIQ